MKAKQNLLLAMTIMIGLCCMIFGTFLYKTVHPSAIAHETHFRYHDTAGFRGD